MRWLLALSAAVVLGLTAAALALAVSRPDAQVEIRIRYSAFLPGSVLAVVGQPVTFVLENADPIDHEWIVGDAATHERHRTGTEPAHASRPTEVSIPALESRTTTVVFDEPGTYQFICHLPGHEAYGMVGTVVVRP